MLTLEVFFSIPEGQSPDRLDARLGREAERIVGLTPSGTAMRVGHNLKHHRMDALAAGNSLEVFDGYLATGLVPNHSRVPLTSFDSVLEVSLVDESAADVMLDSIDGLVQRLGDTVDPARSAAVLGIDHPISAGSGPVQLFVCLRRVQGSHEEFCDWWLHQLVEHTTKTPGKSGYRQLHGDPRLSARAAEAAGVMIDDFDGVALEFYPDLKRFYSAVEWANQPNAAIVQAETQMIDFARAMAIMTYDPDK